MGYVSRFVQDFEEVNEQLLEIEQELGGMEPVVYPSLLNSWVNYNATYQSVRFWKTSNNLVYLEGMVKSGTVPADIFILPRQYRPTYRLIFSCISNSTVGRVDVETDGSVSAQGPSSNVWISFGGIVFRADKK